MAAGGRGSLNKYLQHSYYERISQMVSLEIIDCLHTSWNTPSALLLTPLPSPHAVHLKLHLHNLKQVITNDRITPGFLLLFHVPVHPSEHDRRLWNIPERAPPAWVSGLWCVPHQEPPLSLSLLPNKLWIKSLLSRCLFKLRHRLIAEHPLENWEIHTWKRVGDWEVLRKKHRGRLPLQLEKKAHAYLWIED